MKFPDAVVAVALSALILLESWTLEEVVNLKVDVARLTVRVAELQKNQNHQTANEQTQNPRA